MDKQTFADRYLSPYKTHGDEIIPKHCPFCQGGQHHDKNTFAFNIRTGGYNCARGSCAVKGSFKNLCDHFGEETDDYIRYKERYTPKVYSVPKADALKTIPKQIVNYFANRRISENTLKKCHVLGSPDGNILFPYFFGGKLVLVKYKIPRESRILNGKKEKKSWQEPGGMPVLWGIDDCNPDLGVLVIVEGEPDRLALIESSVPNIVSVPFGTKNLDWIQTCWEQLAEYEKIIFWSDYDKAGRDMLNLVSQRLGVDRCYYVNTAYNDANDQLMKYSDDIKAAKESICESVLSAKLIPISDVIDMADIEDLDFSNIKATYSGILELDNILGGFKEGLVTVWSGKRGDGKSTLLNHLLISETIEQGEKIGVYSGEYSARILRFLVELPLAGDSRIKQTLKLNGELEPSIEKQYRDDMKEWYRGRVFIYDNTKSNKPEDILNRFKELAMRDGVKAFLIDNLMTLDFRGSEQEQNNKQGDFIRACKKFATAFGVHVHIVTHPRKSDSKSPGKWIIIDDVKGSGDITNAADNVILVHRIREKKDPENDKFQADACIQVCKNKLLGTEKIVVLLFDEVSRRFYKEEWQRVKRYGWDSSAAENMFDILDGLDLSAEGDE